MQIKSILFISFLFFPSMAFCQSNIALEKKLSNSFQKISNWSAEKYGKNSFDSLELFNDNFEKQALSTLNRNPESLKSKFDQLNKMGLKITSSKDGFLRIYSWDDQTGGTQRRFRNIYQTQTAGITKAFIKKNDPGVTPLKIYDLTINKQRYYILTELFIGSSALFYFKVKLLRVEKNVLNNNLKLISTKSGLTNELSYEIDYSARINKDNEHKIEHFYPYYNSDEKEISIPLVQADGKFTNKRITYKLIGAYFKKVI